MTLVLRGLQRLRRSLALTGSQRPRPTGDFPDVPANFVIFRRADGTVLQRANGTILGRSA